MMLLKFEEYCRPVRGGENLLFNTFTYTANHYPRIIEVTVLEAVKRQAVEAKSHHARAGPGDSRE